MSKFKKAGEKRVWQTTADDHTEKSGGFAMGGRTWLISSTTAEVSELQVLSQGTQICRLVPQKSEQVLQRKPEVDLKLGSVI